MEAAVPSNTSAEATNRDGVGSLPDRSKQPKAKKEKAPKQSKPMATTKPPSKAKPKPGSASEPSAPIDLDAMFKVGFLADVYQERPKSSEGIQKVVTRCAYLLFHRQLILCSRVLKHLCTQSHPSQMDSFTSGTPKQLPSTSALQNIMAANAICDWMIQTLRRRKSFTRRPSLTLQNG